MALAVVTKTEQVKSNAEMPVGLSVGNHLIDLSDENLDAAMDDVVELNVPWVRLDIDWRTVQPESRSSWKFDRTDRVIDAANKRGIKVLAIVTYTPEWARQPGCTRFACPPRSRTEFATFVSKVATRYGEKVDAYEIWNEPNWDGFWVSPDPARYGRLLARAAGVLKRDAPHAKRIFGGLSAAEPGAYTIDAARFIRTACARGACDGLSAIGYHPYTYPRLATDKNQPYTTWQRALNDFGGHQGLRPALRESGLGDMPIWITEYGAPTGRGGETGVHVSESRQAAIMYSGLRAADRDSDQIGGLFWYTLKDLRGVYNNTEDYFGIRRANGKPKPAWGVTRSALEPR